MPITVRMQGHSRPARVHFLHAPYPKTARCGQAPLWSYALGHRPQTQREKLVSQNTSSLVENVSAPKFSWVKNKKDNCKFSKEQKKTNTPLTDESMKRTVNTHPPALLATPSSASDDLFLCDGKWFGTVGHKATFSNPPLAMSLWVGSATADLK